MDYKLTRPQSSLRPLLVLTRRLSIVPFAPDAVIVSRDLSVCDEDDRTIFLGLKFSIPGFLVGKIGKFCFS